MEKHEGKKEMDRIKKILRIVTFLEGAKNVFHIVIVIMIFIIMFQSIIVLSQMVN